MSAEEIEHRAPGEWDEPDLHSYLRQTDEPDVRGVEATGAGDSWQVTVWAMEFVRDEPLESQLRERIAAALRGVAGVDDVDEEDREVWAIDGPADGEALVRVTAAAVDEFADRIRPHTHG